MQLRHTLLHRSPLFLTWCPPLLHPQEVVKVRKRTRDQIHRSIDPDYFGYRDEDDGLLLAAEEEAEVALRKQLVKQHAAAKAERKRQRAENAAKAAESQAGAGAGAAAGAAATTAADSSDDDEDADAAARAAPDAATSASMRSHVVLPTQADIERLVVERKRKMLLSMYASQALQQKQGEAKSLLNVK